MKKRLMSMLLCAAMIFAAMPGVLAAESDTRSGAKFGIERGDVVLYAGEGAPIAWYVIDAEKSNTGDENGIFLFSKNTSKLIPTEYSTELMRLKPYYQQFYDEFFSDYYRTAVMPVSMDDEQSMFGGYKYIGKLDNDTVFALSYAEVNKLSEEERSFGSYWWMRSFSEGYYDFMLSMIVEPKFLFNSTGPKGTNFINTTNDSKSRTIHIRPAVNIDKTKLAGLDGLPLLLPAGELSEAENNLVPLAAASEWKLTQKNNDAAITNVVCELGEYNGEYKLTVDTNLQAVGANDRISLIIGKSDGSISHYGRYAMTSATSEIEFTLPDDFDNTNDSVYVFYEDYRGAMPGSASAVTKVCLGHELVYGLIDENTHSVTCTKCGYYEVTAHDFEKIDKDDLEHTAFCYNCRYRGNEAHTYKVAEAHEDNHILECIGCAHRTAEEHAYSGEIGSTETSFNCSVCGRKAPFTAIENDFGAEIAAVRDEYKKDSAKIYQNNGRYVKISADGIFSGGNYVTCNGYATAMLSFNTNRAVKPIGFKIITGENKKYIPGRITLYGRKSSAEEYKKIGLAVIKPLLPTIAEGESYLGRAYSFMFADTAQTAQYDDFMLELYKDDYNGTDPQMQLDDFALISEKKTSFAYSLDGAVIDGTQPDAVYPEEDLSFTVRSKAGYPKKEEITISCDGAALDDNAWSYSEETGTFTLFGEYVSKDRTYFLKISCVDKNLSVEHELTGLTVSVGSEAAEFGKDYICVFADSNGNTAFVPTSLASGDIKVYCGDKDITELCDGSQLSEGRLTIPGKYVLGNIRISAREKCSTENESSMIKIERTGKPTHWHDNATDARIDILSGGDMTVTLLKDVHFPLNTEGFVFDNAKVTVDLNGHAITASSYITVIEAENYANVTLKNGTIGINADGFPACRVSENAALYIDNVSVCADDRHGYVDIVGGKVVVNNGEDKPIYNIQVQNGGSLEVKNGLLYNLTLLSGGICKLYCGTVYNAAKYKDTVVNPMKLDYKELLGEGCEFYNIKSQEDFDAGERTGFSVRCCHVNIDKHTGECVGCGHKFLMKAINGENVNWYDDARKAMDYANENANTTIKLLENVDPSTESSGGWIELAAQNTTLDLNGKSLATSYPISVVGTGTLTVTGNGVMISSMHAYEIDGNNPMMVIENGNFTGSVSGTLLLKGGRFTTLYGSNHTQMLADGKVLQSADGGFVQPDSKMMNVTVVDVPFTITKQPESKLLADASAEEIISVEVKARSGYENSLTYTWYERTAEYNAIPNSWKYSDKLLENETAPQLQLPKNLPAGTQKTYRCMISCNGYYAYTDYATYTFGSAAPILEFDRDNNLLRVNSNGTDCVVAVAAYSNGTLMNVKTQSIKAQDGIFTDRNFLGIDYEGANCIKIFLFDSMDTMKPLAEPVTILREIIGAFIMEDEIIAISESAECTVAFAVYDGNVLADIYTVRLDESNEYFFEATYEEIGFSAEDAANIKVLVWEDMRTMKPLPFELNKE